MSTGEVPVVAVENPEMEEEDSDDDDTYEDLSSHPSTEGREEEEADEREVDDTALEESVAKPLPSVTTTETSGPRDGDLNAEIRRFIELLPGEVVLHKEENITNENDSGILYITNFQIVYVGWSHANRHLHNRPASAVVGSLHSDSPSPPSQPPTVKGSSSLAPPAASGRHSMLEPRSDRETLCDIFFHVPLGTIVNVQKIGRRTSAADSLYSLAITCKDLRQQLRFGFPRQTRARKRAYETLVQFAFPGQHLVFAFYLSPRTNLAETRPELDGWKIYDPEAEYKRMGLPSYHWRLSSVNEKYDICRSYPPVLAVPAKANDDLLRKSAEFRSSGRIPVLCFKNLYNMATMCRSSQPRVGVARNRSAEDEHLLDLMRESNPLADVLFIMDARPKVNAYANAAKGAGFESVTNYKGCAVEFQGIENIHAVRESLHKLRDFCQSTTVRSALHGDGSQTTKKRTDAKDAKFWSNLEATHYLAHIRSILSGVARIVYLVGREGASVLLHCSDGWDRTPQLSALSMMCVDPYYRTIPGFAVLIEKEWCSFGHKFAARVGHGVFKYPNDQLSPIFLQFIDCVRQLQCQYPSSFEFNEALLIDILDALYSCQFGTFLFNCDRERVIANLKSRTQSFWSHMLVPRRREGYTNHNYQPDRDPPDGVLEPHFSSKDVTLWSNYFLRFSSTGGLRSEASSLVESVSPGPQRPTLPQDGAGAALARAPGPTRELQMKVDQLEKDKTELQAELTRTRAALRSARDQVASLTTERSQLKRANDDMAAELAMLRTTDPLSSGGPLGDIPNGASPSPKVKMVKAAAGRQKAAKKPAASSDFDLGASALMGDQSGLQILE